MRSKSGERSRLKPPHFRFQIADMLLHRLQNPGKLRLCEARSDVLRAIPVKRL